MGFDHHETIEFSKRSTIKGVSIFLLDAVVFVTLVYVAICSPQVWLQIFGALAAGVTIALLFIVAHDAAHHSLTRHVWLNGLIGRIAMLPSLHTFSLWQLVHNQTHHRWTNLSPYDYVWTPLSREQYDGLSKFRKWVYRLHRSVFGPLVYYFFEFWIKRIMFPSRKEVRGEYKLKYLLDIALVGSVGIAYLAFLAVGGHWGWFQESASVSNAIVFGFVLPYFVWNVLMGFVIYLHHTHPHIRWFNDREEWRQAAQQTQSTVHVVFPGPINFFFHWIMEHNAHHDRPSIPLYNLRTAQAHLASKRRDYFVFHWTPRSHRDVARRCKLYDFEAGRWMNFQGEYTSPAHKQKRPELQPHFRRAAGRVRPTVDAQD